ncbi:hypothetical protein M569_08912, partial [Genlisea aurea]
IPDSCGLKTFFVALILLLLFPAIFLCYEVYFDAVPSQISGGFETLPILMRDLLDEGLIKKGFKGYLVGDEQTKENFDFLKESEVYMVMGDADQILQKKNDAVDFVISSGFHALQVFDGMLRDEGLVIFPLSSDPSTGPSFFDSRNYKIVYLRRFDNTYVAMRKTTLPLSPKNIAAEEEMKRTILKGLEDAYLEPPRRKPPKIFTSRKIKFLPDLLKGYYSLAEYPRRVFISDESTALDWFYKNYPMRDQEFEIYNVEGTSGGVSSWLEKKVKTEDYVVMKAEAEVVEEVLRDQRMYLVDELFLECRNEWELEKKDNRLSNSSSSNKRAYWQCLELYGKVRDQGIAVHQWWN